MTHHSSKLALACIGLLCAPLICARPAFAQEVSLEERLADLQSEAEAQIEKIRSKVSELLADHVRAVEIRDVNAAAKLATKIANTGPGVRRLLIEKLDPGKAPTKVRLATADSALVVLAGLPLAAGLAELRTMATEGSALGRLNALRALSYAEISDGVDGFLARRVREDGPVEERAEAIASLARLQGGVARSSLVVALTSDASELRTRALDSLIENEWDKFGSDLGRLVSTPTMAREHGQAVIRYFELRPRELELQTVRALLTAAIETVPDPGSIVLIERIGDLQPKFGEVKDLIEKLAERGGSENTEAAWVLGARLGDRESLKRLREVYDFWVERRDRGDHMPFLLRARMFLRLRETDKAIDDYRDALSELEGAERAEPDDLRTLRIEVARAYALAGNLQRAGGTLEDANLNQEQKLTLVSDPLFADLLAHPRHGRVLRNEP